MNTDLYIVTRPADLRGFVHQADREYFAKPVKVHPVYSCVATRMLYVHDPVRNMTFPCVRECLRTKFRLTNKQRRMIG